MTASHIGFPARAWLAALGAMVLVSCSGGGGDSGATTTRNGLTPAVTQAPISELADAFAATLTGAQEVPARPSGATGSGTVVIHPSTRQMTATLTTTAIAGTDAHIHLAPPGTNGPIIFPLTEATRGSGIWITRATLTEAQINAFRAGDFYFNVHSINFADGEIRGQILSQQAGTTTTVTTGTGTSTIPGTGSTSVGAGLNPFVTSTATFLAALRGSQEVPPTRSAAHGSATVLINPANRQLIAAVTTIGIPGNAAHIHEAPAGTNGSILIPLTEAIAGSGIWFSYAVLTDAQFSSLRAGNMYFNVHSAAFPGGEIRGQILPQTIALETITGAAGLTGSTGTSSGTSTGSTTTGSGIPGTGTTGTGMTGASTGALGANAPGATANVGLAF